MASYGTLVLGVATFLSCVAMPAATWLMMRAGGAIVASGDLALASLAGAALTAAIFRNQDGNALGRRGGSRPRKELNAAPPAST